MKEIIVTKPSECPFHDDEYQACNLEPALKCDEYENVIKFPPDCPLFENDYIVKRRSNANTKEN